MKLIKEVETNSSIKSMSIYKLDDEESKKYNAKFVMFFVRNEQDYCIRYWRFAEIILFGNKIKKMIINKV